MVEAISSAMIDGAHTTLDRAMQLLHLQNPVRLWGADDF